VILGPAPSRAVRAGILAFSLTALAGCSDASAEEARSLARQACTAPAPVVPAGFQASTASTNLLGELAESAALRRMLADRAAVEDGRWQGLADAAGAIASFAGVLRHARSVGRDVDEAVTPAMWDQYKYASDAFVVECRAAL
jgi:hypothetical protein